MTEYGNGMLKRVPFEEWGLKSIPSLNATRREQELSAALEGRGGAEEDLKNGKRIVAVDFPEGFIEEGEVMRCMKVQGGEEKQAFHRKWFWGSVAAMPVTLPAALVPV